MKEFENSPIQFYIEEPLTLALDPTKQQDANLFIEDASTELLDDIFAYWRLTAEKFFHIQNVKFSSQNLFRGASGRKPILAQVIVKLDQKLVIYGRLADTVFTGLESIGGFYESVSHIGLLLVFFFQERLFKSSFLRQLY
jgi:hypothetical protein